MKIWSGGKWADLAPAGKKFGPELGFGRAIKAALPDDEVYLISGHYHGPGLIERGKDFAKAIQAAKK